MDDRDRRDRDRDRVAGLACPICEAPVKPRAENPAFPFCSSRCRLIDLGKWLDEDYRIEGDPASSDEQGKQ